MQKTVLSLLLFAASSLLGQNSITSNTDPMPARIVFIGDSISAGVGVSDPKTSKYSTVATRLLNHRYPNATEINLAQSGRALCQQRPTYAQEVLDHDPDVLIVQWGVNDHYWGHSVSQFVSRYDQLVHSLRASRPTLPIVLTTLVADFRWPENLDLWIGEANIAIQEIAARYQCHVGYVHRALDHDPALYADTIHPNTAGAKAMAKAIVDAFEAPPLSNENLNLQFDQGREIRFNQYVFIPQWGGLKPQWIRVTNLSQNGMRLETPVPIVFRTPAIYSKGDTYRIEIRDPGGKKRHSIEQDVNWNRMLQFTIDPSKSQSFLEIAIIPISDGRP